MSVKAFNFVKQMPGVPRRVLPLLMVIAENAFEDSGAVRIGNRNLAEQSRCSPATLKRYLKELAKLQIIRVERRGRPDGSGGRAFNVITLIGFSEWCRQRDQTEPKGGLRDQTEPVEWIKSRKVRAQQVSPLYKDQSVPSNRTREQEVASQIDWVAIVRGTPAWDRWTKEADRRDRALGDRMRSQRAFMAYVPASEPFPGASLPEIVEPDPPGSKPSQSANSKASGQTRRARQ